MNLGQAQKLMSELGEQSNAQTIVSDGRVVRAEFKRDEANTLPERSAVVSTPGDGWFAITIDGGFTSQHIEENILDEDARRILQSLFRAASTYVSEGASRTGTRFWPGRVVDSDGERLVLRRSVFDDLRSAFRFGARS